MIRSDGDNLGRVATLPGGADGICKLLPPDQQQSLVAWFKLYMAFEAGAGSPNTFKAKRRDVQQFLSYFESATRSDHPDQWTRSITGGFIRHP